MNNREPNWWNIAWILPLLVAVETFFINLINRKR